MTNGELVFASSAFNIMLVSLFQSLSPMMHQRAKVFDSVTSVVDPARKLGTASRGGRSLVDVELELSL